MLQMTSKIKMLLPVLLMMTISVGNSASAQSTEPHATPVTKASLRAQLVAHVEPAIVKRGSPVTVKLSLKNVSRDPVRVLDTFDEQDYEFLVVDGSGTEAKRTDLGRHLIEDEKRAFRASLRLIEQGETVEASIEVTKIYELTEPRTYYVRVMRTLLPASDKADPKTVEKAYRTR